MARHPEPQSDMERRSTTIRIWSDTVKIIDAMREKMSGQGWRGRRPYVVHRATLQLAQEMGIDVNRVLGG